jgi:hypothetical protein
MNKRIKELAEQAGFIPDNAPGMNSVLEKFAELIVQECVDQVEQAKNSPFVSLDDAKRMKHFVDVTTKKIQKHFGVEQ